MRRFRTFIDWMLIRNKPPDIAVAQFRELGRQIPLLYALIIVNAVAVSFTHYGHAPDWLTVWTLIPLAGLCAIRMIVWLVHKDRIIEAGDAIRQLRRTIILGTVIATVFITWSLLLEQYGGAYERAHVAFFIAITVIGCVMCLTYLPQAALLVMIIVTAPYMIYYISGNEPVFIAIALNIFLVCLVMLRVLFNE